MYGSIKMSWLSFNSTVATGNRSGEGSRKAEELGMFFLHRMASAKPLITDLT
jgi:hypothetical protein